MEAQIIAKTDIRDWQIDLKNQGRSPHTIASYAFSAEAYRASAAGRADRASVRQWQSELADSGASLATQAIRVKALKQFFRWLRAEGIIDADPMTSIKIPSVKPVPVEPLTRKQIDAIIAACETQKERAIISLLASTGMRVGELHSITLDQLRLDERVVYVNGKTGWRTVPISDATALELARYLRRHPKTGPLWTGQRGPMSRSGIQALIYRSGRRVGLRTNPHLFRHSFANLYLQAGGSEQGLMKICGWVTTSQMHRYSAYGARDRAMDEFRRVWR